MALPVTFHSPDKRRRKGKCSGLTHAEAGRPHVPWVQGTARQTFRDPNPRRHRKAPRYGAPQGKSQGPATRRRPLSPGAPQGQMFRVLQLEIAGPWNPLGRHKGNFQRVNSCRGRGLHCYCTATALLLHCCTSHCYCTALPLSRPEGIFEGQIREVGLVGVRTPQI
jgi:hypothetical protein